MTTTLVKPATPRIALDSAMAGAHNVAGVRTCRHAVEQDMEPERPKVGRVVLRFVKSHVFDPADFVIRADGVCRLNPEMARMVVVGVSAKKIP